MAKKVALVHGTRFVLETMDRMVRERIPQVEIFNILDEGLLRRLFAVVDLTPEICRDFCQLIVSAEKAGADAVLVTGSSFSPCVDTARLLVGIPVYKIDEPMAAEAVQLGSRIGILATETMTVKPSTDLIRQKAAEMGKEVSIQVVHVQEVFDLARAGHHDDFDRIIAEKAADIAAAVDVLILAQVSMARALPVVRMNVQIPILSSPETAIRHLALALADSVETNDASA